MPEISAPPVAVPVGGLADSVYRTAVDQPGRGVLCRRPPRSDPGAGWREVTAAAFRDEVLALAKGLLVSGVRFGDRVGVMSRTRYEWTLFDFALWSVGAQPVPVPVPCSAAEAVWILREAGAVACVVEDEEQAMTVGSVLDRLPALERLWQLDAGAVPELAAAGAHLADGVVDRHRAAIGPRTAATVVHTAGATGPPRACLLTHGNLMAAADGLLAVWNTVPLARRGGASALLFLPLTHVLGRLAEVACVRGRIRFGHLPARTADEVPPVLAAFRPSVLLGTPGLYEAVYEGARREAAAAGRAELFEEAERTAVRYARERQRRACGAGGGPDPALRARRRWYDQRVYAGIRARLGGRPRLAFCGGAPLDPRLGLFFAGAGVEIVEGYGPAECAGAATANPPGFPRYGTVGRPLPGTAVRVAEDGEVWLCGGQVFAGYLERPGAPPRAPEDGWLATGDLGALDGDGYLAITGRTAELLATSSGRRFSPVPLEEAVRGHPLVAQCVVLGDGRPFVAALVALEEEAVQRWLAARGRPLVPAGGLVRDPELVGEIRRAVSSANAAAPQAEPIHTFRVVATPFREEEPGLLASRRSPRRAEVERAFAREIEALYDRPDGVPGATGG